VAIINEKAAWALAENTSGVENFSWTLSRSLAGRYTQNRERVLALSRSSLWPSQSAVIYCLKFVIQRQRPFLFLEMASKLSKGPGEILDPSFPSAMLLFIYDGHSAGSLVPSILDYFLHHCCIRQLDANST